MNRIRTLVRSLLLLSSIAALAGAAVPSADWPAWRGPTRDGHAAPGQTVPVTWTETENIIWKASVRGKGHSSPTVVGKHIYLSTADHGTQEQLVLCFDRASGKLLWETVIHRGPLNTIGHRNSSQASSSVVSDSDRLYINFVHDQAVYTTALDPTGKILWQRRVSDFVMHQGFGSSPVIHENVVLVTADHKGGGRLAGLDKRTGNILWEQGRPEIANYPSAAVFTIAGRTQMIIAGCNLIASFEPLTGKKLWEFEGSTQETVITPVTDGKRVFISGGFPRNHLAAIEADGSGQIAWQHNTRLYVPSMLVKEGHLYAILDTGHAVCWKSDTGEELWREKIDRDFYSSPVMLDNRIYATSLRGVTSVIEVSPQGSKLLGQSQLGDDSIASPSICGNRIYLRTATKAEPRQEFLWAIGSK